MARLIRWTAWAVLWFGLWLLLVEKFELAELIVGTVCALLAAIGSGLVWDSHLTAFRPRFRQCSQIWRLPKIVVVGTATIFVVLFRHLFTRKKAQSLVREVAFDAGGDDDPEGAARRALAITYTTMTPNFIVLGIDTKTQTMLYHQIEDSDVPTMTVKLGARP